MPRARTGPSGPKNRAGGKKGSGRPKTPKGGAGVSGKPKSSMNTKRSGY